MQVVFAIGHRPHQTIGEDALQSVALDLFERQRLTRGKPFKMFFESGLGDAKARLTVHDSGNVDDQNLTAKLPVGNGRVPLNNPSKSKA